MAAISTLMQFLGLLLPLQAGQGQYGFEAAQVAT